jgi:hypothetical protein
MNRFQLGGMCRSRRFVDDLLQIEKSQVRLARSKRPLLHFSVHGLAP